MGTSKLGRGLFLAGPEAATKLSRQNRFRVIIGNPLAGGVALR
jgi:hypothetical protein